MITAEKILTLLESYSFENWYVEEFIPYVEGEEECPSRQEILEYLKRKLEG